MKLHDHCSNPRCKCQKQILFSPHQFQFEGAGFKNTRKKIITLSLTAWNKCLKPAIIATAPVIEMAVGAKTKNPQVAQATTNILKNIFPEVKT